MSLIVPRRPRITARARPGAVPLPGPRRAAAFTEADVYQRWSDEAAGIRPAAVEGGDNIITMFDMIGEDWWTGGGITAKQVTAQLRAIGDRPVEVQINSPGGDLFEGFTIYNVLREHPQPITVKIMGMAASAASVIAMAGDEVQIGAASFLMIHNCAVSASGNRHDFAEIAQWLEPYDMAMRDVYAARTGQDAAAVSSWMNAETYMSGSLAMERGFADALLPADAVRLDETVQASERAANEVRAMEMTLIAGGATRSEARARINRLKGKPDAARTTAMPDAGAPELAASLTGLLNAFH